MSTSAFSQCCLPVVFHAHKRYQVLGWLYVFCRQCGPCISLLPFLSFFIRLFFCILLCQPIPATLSFFWCLYTAFDATTPSYHSKIEASISAYFLLSRLVVILEGQIPLSEMQRCSWFPSGQYSI